MRGFILSLAHWTSLAFPDCHVRIALWLLPPHSFERIVIDSSLVKVTATFLNGEIVFHGIALRPRVEKQEVVLPPTSAPASAEVVEASNLPTDASKIEEMEGISEINDIDGSFQNPSRGRKLTRMEALDDLWKLIAERGELPPQKLLCIRWGVPSGTVSKWCKRWRQSGEISRRTNGSCQGLAKATPEASDRVSIGSRKRQIVH
jgi:hypothetical protein